MRGEFGEIMMMPLILLKLESVAFVKIAVVHCDIVILTTNQNM